MALDGSWHQFVSVAGSEKVKSAILGMLAFALASVSHCRMCCCLAIRLGPLCLLRLPCRRF